MCPCCREELNGRSVKSYIADMQTPDTAPSSGLQTQVEQLFKLVESLSEKVDCCMPKNTSDRTPMRSKAVEDWPRLGVKRRRGNDKQPITVAPDRGTNTIDLSDLSIPHLTPETPTPKFWLYLSGLHPLVTVDDIHKITSRCLKLTAPADVVRLVPKGVDMANLTFVSFKVGLDPSTKDLALDAATWPNGILFREFIDQSKNQVRMSNAAQSTNAVMTTN